MTSQPSFTSGVSVETDRQCVGERRRHPHRGSLVRRGFTLIEILTVVAIIALLATITVVSLRSVGGNAKEKEARTVLEIMRSAVSQAVPVDNPKAGDRFYGNFLPTKYSLTGASTAAAVAANGLASDNSTVDVVKYLSSNPAVKKLIEGLPNQLRKSVGGVTVPVDPWGNEIKFVYGNLKFVQGDSLVVNPSLGGLGKMYSKSALQYWRGTGAPAYNGPTISGSTFNPRPELALQAPDKSCFWVSAGPDGDFETHDDNLYSFEGN